MRDNKDISVEKQLTDHFAIDIGDVAPGAVNAEIEKNEWLMYPDGKLQKGYGEKHSNGGIEVDIPDGTRVLTDSIPIGRDNAKRLSKKYDMKFSAKDTFSKVVDKYSKKVGMSKVIDDQAEYFKQLRKNTESKLDESTKLINEEFLSGKINDLEGKKAIVEQEVSKMFEEAYHSQELKKAEKPGKYENKDNEAKYGGMSVSDLGRVASRMGLTQDQVIDIATKGKHNKKKKNIVFKLGGIKKYEEGDEKNFPKDRDKAKSEYAKGNLTKEEYIAKRKSLASQYGKTYSEQYDPAIVPRLAGTFTKVTLVEDVVSKELGYAKEKDTPGHQSRYGAAFSEEIGKEGSIELFFDKLNTVFHDVYEKEFGNKSPEEVAKSFNQDTDKGKALVKRVQEGMDASMRGQANYIIDNPGGFSEEYIEFAKEYLDTKTFVDCGGENNAVNCLDGKLGKFTAAREPIRLNALTPDELDSKPDNVYDVGDIDKDSEWYKSLSDESKDRLGLLKGTNFLLDTYVPVEDEPTKKPEDTQESGETKDDVNLDRNRRPADNTYYPYYVPSSIPLQPQMAQEISLNRIDPLRLRYEEDNQALRQAMERTERSGMTPQQQLATNAAMLSNQQKADVAGQMQALQATAQNYAQADQYNAQIGDKEEMMNAQLNKRYFDEVASSLNAKRLNEEDRRLAMHRQALANYDQNRMNSIYQELFDYNPGYFSTVGYDPRADFMIQNLYNRNQALGTMAQPEQDSNKKSSSKPKKPAKK